MGKIGLNPLSQFKLNFNRKLTLCPGKSVCSTNGRRDDIWHCEVASITVAVELLTVGTVGDLAAFWAYVLRMYWE